MIHTSPPSGEGGREREGRERGDRGKREGGGREGGRKERGRGREREGGEGGRLQKEVSISNSANRPLQ